jgi:single-stranded-DNA-specific exonuclease
VVRRRDDIDAAAVAAQAREHDTPLVVAHLLWGRDVREVEAQRRVLAPRLSHLRRPDAMAGFEPALDLLVWALEGGHRIGIFGDYDVDGVTTATILATYLEALGASVVVRVAHRDRGYGFGVADAESFVQARAELVLTGDCGTSDVPALSWLAERDVPCVVIDHHQVPESMPPARALINPHQPDCGFPFKGLCSAGVAFYLCAALRTRLAAQRRQLPDPRGWLDLVALATVCDMMPLVEENRVLVTHGLGVMGARRRPGLAALLAVAGVDAGQRVDEGHLGFKLGPRINAPGRLGAAEPALELLRARTATEAEPLAQRIETLNATRRRHSDRTAAEAMALVAADPQMEQRAALVVAHEGWLSGIVGISAARLAEHYKKPALVLAIDAEQGVARGSVRSFGGADVRGALAECAALLERFGGHREAAGTTVRVEHLPELAEAFAAAVAAQARAATPEDTEEVDASLTLDQVDFALLAGIRRLGPYGVGFSAPRFAIDACTVSKLRVLKERHLALSLTDATGTREAIAFGQAFHDLSVGDQVGCIFAPINDRFRGEDRLRLEVARLWRV